MRPWQEGTQHTGEERYEVTLKYSPEDIDHIKSVTREGDVIPDRVVLVWTRWLNSNWRRAVMGANGSRVEGHTKVSFPRGAVGPFKTREIFTRNLGELKRSSRSLPGLALAIEDAEASLPD